MSYIVTETFSDVDMACPADWENGFKEARVIRFGDGERALSHEWTGDWQGSTFSLEVSDFDRHFRELLSNATGRFWTEPQEIKMTTRANRADLGTPYTVFVGLITDVQPSRPLAMRFTFSDIVSQGLLADQHQIPWRVIRDGFLSEIEVSDTLDLDAPEPIIYGRHLRIAGDDIGSPAMVATPQGFQYTPTYLGIEDGYHLWMVCGHACADVPDVLVWTPVEENPGSLGTSVSVVSDSDWLIPHTSAPAYEDRRSDTYGNNRRYTLIRGLVGNADADGCANGSLTLTCIVDGIEETGDGSGQVIQDRIQQYKHFLINFVANRGRDSYQSGDWLSNPTWDLFGSSVTIVDEDSFDDCSTISIARYPIQDETQDWPAGYIGAAIIGAAAGDRSSVRRWIADWNRCCSVRFGITRYGRMRVCMLSPTQAIKDAAPLYTDAYEILDQSFEVGVHWSEMANRVPFRADYEHSSGQYKTAGVASAGDAITQYGREIMGEVREYPFVPTLEQAAHLANLEVLVRQHPPRTIRLEATVGPDPVTDDSLGYRELGDYIRYNDYASVGSSAGQIRLAQITKLQVQAGRRRVLIEAIDCDDLIDYDVFDSGDTVSPINDSCETALEIASEIGPQAWHINTNAHGTADMIGSPAGSPGSPGLWSGTNGYHAAFWKGTAPAGATRLFLTTVHSLYDTQMAVFTGSCGSPGLTEIAYNDNDEGFGTNTSVLDIEVTPGVEYFVLVAGYEPNDAGSLTFGAYFYNPEDL